MMLMDEEKHDGNRGARFLALTLLKA